MKGAVAEDARVVDENVYLAVGVQRRLDYRLAARQRVHTVVVRRRLAAGGADLLCHLVGHGAAPAGAIAGPSQVVHHHLGAPRGEEQGVGAAQAAAGAGDDRYAVIKSNFTHI